LKVNFATLRSANLVW